MTTANKLTLFRIILVPVMVIIAFIPFFNDTFVGAIRLANLINIIIFVLASITDFLDGYIARKTKTVTTFGKFLDPIADKLLTTSALIILAMQLINEPFILPFWSVIIIVSREFIVSGIRLVCANKNNVIAAGWSGKIKTATTMVGLIILFLHEVSFGGLYLFKYVGSLIMYVALLATIYSGCEYFIKNRKFLLESM